MRETINILKYGFVLFLLISGIVSIFTTETYFVSSVNSLSIPIFAFSISILFVKSNQYARTEILKQIQNKDTLINNQKMDIDKRERSLNEIPRNINLDEYHGRIENYKQLNQLYSNSLISLYEYKYLSKFFSVTDTFTKIFNVIATLSFSWCLLSLTGLFRITNNYAGVNIFSLALVFFDFFILDNLTSNAIRRKFNHLHEKAEREIRKNEE